MTPLEALAVDYVKANDNFVKLEKEYEKYYEASDGLELMRTNAGRKEEVRQARGKVISLLAAISSHVHAAYCDELSQGSAG